MPAEMVRQEWALLKRDAWSPQNIIDCYDVTTCQAACSSAGVTQGTCGRLLAGYGYGLVYALLYYAESRHNMDSNMTAIIADVSHLKGITKAEQVTPEIAAKFDSLYNHTVSLKAAGDSMLSNLIFVHYLSGGYYLCLPPPLENNSINSAVSKSFDMKTRTACFGTLNSDADALLNNTQNRINYYINVKQKASIASDFQELMDRYNSISGNVTGILSVFEVPDIRASVANIENYSAMYYIYTSAQNYEAAAGQVDLLAKEVENLASLIVDANAAYSILSTSRNRAIKNLDRLNLVISPSDSSITAERDALIVKFNMLEANLSAKISYSDVPALAEQYDVLAGQAQQLTNKLGELEAGKVSNIFSNFARGMSLAILNAISDPLGVREDEKRTWMSIIPTMFILIVDIIVLAVIALAFFFLVWRRTKEFLRKKIINTWMLIFGFIILIIIGMSFALNSMIKDAIGPSSYFEFASYLESSDSVYIFVEYSSSASTAPLT
ncbi:MAG: hypothetical protein QW112_00160, partial [Candidatus Micrarchaeia archaeon]